MMGRWSLAAAKGLLAAAMGLSLSGCAYLLPGPYDDALDAPPPTPRPTSFPSALDDQVLVPWKSTAFRATASQPTGGAAPPEAGATTVQ